MRRFAAGALVAIMAAACSDSTSPEDQPPDVRIESASTPDTYTARLALRNVGGPGEMRVRLWTIPGIGGPIGGPDPAPVLACGFQPVTIRAGYAESVDADCFPSSIAWAVVEVRDGSSVEWRRTACANVGGGSCPASLARQN